MAQQHHLIFKSVLITNNKQSEDRFVFDTGQLVTTLDALGIKTVATKTKEEAQGNMEMLDAALMTLNSNRSSLGALQNRLTSSINNLNLYRENLEGANSRIRDTDMADETSELTKQNILTQSNVSVLSQANSNPQLALKLLG
jgi:flagellin